MLGAVGCKLLLVEDAEATACILKDLKRLGVHLAVDDFGTGYSSLSYLRQFPIDVLKIDQSFVQHISGDPNDSAIVTAIIDMGKNLNLRVIAEGIETPEQLAFLRSRRCAEGQGYLFSRPLAAAQLAKFLEAGESAELGLRKEKWGPSAKRIWQGPPVTTGEHAR